MSGGRLALVTGTSSGIGAAVARALLRREWRVVGIARRTPTIEDFPWGETFRRFHAEGRLVAPELPAADIVEFLHSESAERFKESRYGT